MTKLETLSHLSLIVIGAVVMFAALHELSDIFAPLALALVSGVVLSPVSEYCDRHHLPRAAAALLTLVFTLLLLTGLFLIFQPAVEQLARQAPKVLRDLRETLDMVRSLVQGLTRMTDDVTKAIAPAADAAGAQAKSAKDTGVHVPTVAGALMLAPVILAQFTVFAGSLFFFLLTRPEMYDWAARRLAATSERGKLVSKMRDAERRVSRYFLTIAMINAGLGLLTAAAMQLMGLPQAVTWGLIAFVLNFVPYLGPGLAVAGLLYAGVAAFDGAQSLLPAAAYLGLIVLESQFVTPAMVGRNAAVNPLLVFLALIFGFWLWGPVGGIVAIPLLIWGLVLAGVLPGQPAVASPPPPLPASGE